MVRGILGAFWKLIVPNNVALLIVVDASVVEPVTSKLPVVVWPEVLVVVALVVEASKIENCEVPVANNVVNLPV